MNLYSKLKFVAIVALVVGIGTYLISISQAATAYLNAEPELGTVSAPATTLTDVTASGGKAIKFGATVVGPRICAGFPDASCTGVPTGTALTLQNGGLTVTQANAVIDARDIRGCVTISAPNVTIKRSKISGCSGQHTQVVRNGDNHVTLEDVEIDGGASDANIDLAGVGPTEVTCLRCNIHRTSKGAHLDGANYVIENSWIHDLYMPGDPNANGHGEAIYTDLTINGIIRGNNLDSNNTAATDNNSGSLAIYNLYGGHSNLLVENNLLNTSNAAICMYVGYTHTATNNLSNVKILNNKFGKKYNPACGTWQPAWSASGLKAMGWGSANGNQWSGNTFTDGVVVAPPF